MKLGVGIVCKERQENLGWLVSSLVSHHVQEIRICNIGGTICYPPNHVVRALNAYGINVSAFGRSHDRNMLSLPYSRHVLEDQLACRGCDAFLITDDDLIFESGYLNFGGDWATLHDFIVGGGVVNGWDSPMSDEEYLRSFLRGNSTVTPLGHVPAKTAIYGNRFTGLWRDVHDAGITFDNEDLAWCYLAYEKGAGFVFNDWVALHVPPTQPRNYTDEVFQKFRREREGIGERSPGSAGAS